MDSEEKGDAMTFTDKKPTVPGWYLYQKEYALEPFCVEVRIFDGVVWARGEQPVEKMNGLWSSRLVPVEEVELAYHEGVENKRNQFLSDHPRDWENSRARRVVEGKEGV